MGIVTIICTAIVAAAGISGAVGAAKNYIAREDAVDVKVEYWENIAATWK